MVVPRPADGEQAAQVAVGEPVAARPRGAADEPVAQAVPAHRLVQVPVVAAEAVGVAAASCRSSDLA